MVVHATEEGTHQLTDDQLLELAGRQQRVMITQDIRFRVMAENWQRQGKPFAGLFYGINSR
jgi:predicted nuclease of predicted toxin-antitoxin system